MPRHQQCHPVGCFVMPISVVPANPAGTGTPGALLKTLMHLMMDFRGTLASVHEVVYYFHQGTAVTENGQVRIERGMGKRQQCTSGFRQERVTDVILRRNCAGPMALRCHHRSSTAELPVPGQRTVGIGNDWKIRLVFLHQRGQRLAIGLVGDTEIEPELPRRIETENGIHG